jgi:hypothetical protein
MLLVIFLTVAVGSLGWCVFCTISRERDLNRRIASELNRAGVWDEHPRN